jgi:glutathione S-transferase
MSLKLYFHPLSSYCHKVLIALYENDVAFEPVFVDLGDPASSAMLRALWPVGKFPVLRDEARNNTVAEATIIVEYLDLHFPGRTRFVPAEFAWQTRMWDRFYDLYVHEPMQKIVGDHLRPSDSRDPFGVEKAKAMLQLAYNMIEKDMAGKAWAAGDSFTLIDCAASPALFYANTVMPFGPEQKNLKAYFERLMTRPAYARVLKEAQPFFKYFPLEPKPQIVTEMR